jgi:hypothetical protein
MKSLRSWLDRHLVLFGWLVTAAVLITAFLAWSNSFSWNFNNLSIYLIFPIFGLAAFGIMWSQYLMATIVKIIGSSGNKLTSYFNITGWMVLFFIVIHPGLLSFRLWRDGGGIPPSSEWHFVMPTLHAALLVGMCAWLIFLAYELRRKLSKYGWWKYMEYLIDVAILGVFYHSLKLGSQTHSGWFGIVWRFYGASLILMLVYRYCNKLLSALNREKI